MAVAAPIITFSPAIRLGSRVLIFLYGESGAGKTNTALLLARGLVGEAGRIFGVDTENKRMLVYADDPEIGGFDHGELTPPFSPERMGDAIELAAGAGAQCIVIDSLSHEWNDIGGVIALADDEEERGRKGLLKWQQPKIRHKHFIQRLLRVNCHVIGCMRAKEKFAEVIEGGKKKLMSTGFFPEQDARLKFEATIQMRLSGERPGVPIIEKIPKTLRPAFPDNAQVGVEHGRAIARWVGTGQPLNPEHEDLKQRAQIAAEAGMVALERFWKSLPKPQQQLLADSKPNYKSIAQAHDDSAKGVDDRPAT